MSSLLKKTRFGLFHSLKKVLWSIGCVVKLLCLPACHTALELVMWHCDLPGQLIVHCSSAVLYLLCFICSALIIKTPEEFVIGGHHRFLFNSPDIAFHKFPDLSMKISCVHLVQYCDQWVDSSRKLQEAYTWKPLWHLAPRCHLELDVCKCCLEHIIAFMPWSCTMWSTGVQIAVAYTSVLLIPCTAAKGGELPGPINEQQLEEKACLVSADNPSMCKSAEWNYHRKISGAHWAGPPMPETLQQILILNWQMWALALQRARQLWEFRLH